MASTKVNALKTLNPKFNLITLPLNTTITYMPMQKLNFRWKKKKKKKIETWLVTITSTPFGRLNKISWKVLIINVSLNNAIYFGHAKAELRGW